MKMVFVFLLFCTSVYAQDTSYYDGHWRKVDFGESANFYRVIQYGTTDTNLVSEQIYYMSGELKSEKTYPKWVQDTTYYNSDGKEAMYEEVRDHYKVTKYLSSDTNQIQEKIFSISGKLISERTYEKWVKHATVFYNNRWIEVGPEEEARYYKVLYYSNADTNEVLEKTYFGSGQLREERTYSKFIEDITYYNTQWKEVSTKELANYYKVIRYHLSDTNHVSEQLYNINGELKSEKKYAKWTVYTIYYDYNWEKISFKDSSAHYYEVLYFNNIDTNRAVTKTFYISGNIKMEKSYGNYEMRTLDGLCCSYYENSHIKQKIGFKDGEYDGKFLVYWYNGNLKRVDQYKNGKFIKGECFKPEGGKMEYSVYEVFPKFPGGNEKINKYISSKIVYPKEALKNGIEGRVVVRYSVNTDGTITDVEVITSVNPDLDAEAHRIVKGMPTWTPGMRDGQAEVYTFTVPVVFRIK